MRCTLYITKKSTDTYLVNLVPYIQKPKHFQFYTVKTDIPTTSIRLCNHFQLRFVVPSILPYIPNILLFYLLNTRRYVAETNSNFQWYL